MTAGSAKLCVMLWQGQRLKRRRRRILIVGLWFTAAATAATLGWAILHGSKVSAPDQAAVAGPFLAMLPFAVGLWLEYSSESSDVEDTVKALADSLRRQEGEELTRLRGATSAAGDRQLINIQYRRISPRTTAGPTARGRLKDGTPRVPDIITYFRSCTPARLVISGEPGAGKTVLALELLTELLATRGPEDPVPVRLQLAQWASDEESLEEFITSQLVEAYDQDERVARELVDRGLVLPVLDGLDEMDSGLHDPDGNPVHDSQGTPVPDPHAPRACVALNRLNHYSDGKNPGSVILMCRTAHYTALDPQARLEDATHIQIIDVTATQARSYLAARTRHPAWNQLLEEWRLNWNHCVARHLTTPWRLSLVATIYRNSDPTPLQNLNTAQELNEHLLERLIPTAFRLYPTPRPWSPTDAHRWLARIAHHLTTGSASPHTDIHLHTLWPIAGRRKIRLWDTTLTTLALEVSILAINTLASWTGFIEAPFPWADLPVIAAVAAIMSLRAGREHVAPARWSWPRSRVSSAQGAILRGLTGGIAFRIASGIADGDVGWLAGLLAGGLISWLAGRFWDRPRPASTRRSVIRANILSGLVYLLTFALASEIVDTLTAPLSGDWQESEPTVWYMVMSWHANGSIYRLASLLTSMLAGGLISGLISWLAAGLRDGPRPVSTPGSVVRANVLFGLVYVLAFGLVIGLAYGLSDGLTLAFVFSNKGMIAYEFPDVAAHMIPYAITNGLAIGLLLGLAFGLVFGAAAARRYLVFLLCMRSTLPFRLNLFLAHAHHCQLLRYAGNAYQFRHRELQQWLTIHPTPPTPGPTPTAQNRPPTARTPGASAPPADEGTRDQSYRPGPA